MFVSVCLSYFGLCLLFFSVYSFFALLPITLLLLRLSSLSLLICRSVIFLVLKDLSFFLYTYNSLLIDLYVVFIILKGTGDCKKMANFQFSWIIYI